MKKRQLWILMVGAASCADGAPEGAAPAPSRAAMSSPARWVAAQPVDDRPVMEVPARVVADPRGSAEVTALFRGQVREVHVQPGDPVRQGDPIAHLITPELAEAVAVVSASRSSVQALRARVDKLTALRGQGLARASEVFEVESQLAELETRRALAQSKLRAQGLSAADQRTLASTGQVIARSPIDGIVTDVHVRLGQTVAADGQPLAQVQGPGSSRVEIQLSSPIPEGATAELVTADGVGHALSVTSMRSVVEPQTGTTRAWLALEGPTKLPSGLRATVRVNASGKGWYQVPAAAVATRQGVPSVFVERAGRQRWLPVEVQTRSGASAVVKSDLQIGDRVLADARYAPSEIERDAL